MANETTKLTEYDLSLLQGNDFVTLLQSINTMAGGYLGITMLLTICMVVFGILSLFGDPKSAFFGSSFAGLILGFLFLGIGILSPAIFFLFVLINIAIIIVITR